jgi:hypothetical protein
MSVLSWLDFCLKSNGKDEQTKDGRWDAPMSEKEIREMVWGVAREAASLGSGWAQEGFVLRTIRDRINGGNTGRPDLRLQQMVLNAWHDLFVEKKLVWGYDLDNPGAPFFHVR